MARVHWLGIVLLAFLFVSSLNAGEIPAFPGAEGHGRYTVGGRGGRVIKVTNLNDRGEGSLRAAVEAKGARIVVFDVSGTIALESRLPIRNGQLTIAGQTAPGDGICIKNHEVYLDACDEVILRYLRFRMGDEARQQADALGGQKNRNVIIDHCSMSWSTDECASFYANSNFTMQWCLIGESLRNSIHASGQHGNGGVWGGQNASFHHNLLAHHDSRNPRLGEFVSRYALSDRVDLRNNVIYNWQGNSCYGGEGMNVNIVNNYYKPGPATVKNQERIVAIWNRIETWDPLYNIWGKFYIHGNVLNGSKRATLDNWKYGVQFDSKWSHVTDAEKQRMRLEQPLETGKVTTDTAEEAYQRVLKFAGASLKRDAVDRRIIHDVRTGTATCQDGGNGSRDGLIDTQDAVGGWPVLKSTPAPADTDGDGMPDAWEVAQGLDPADSADGNSDRNQDGYLNLEDYLNSRAHSYYDTKPIVSTVHPKKNQLFIASKPIEMEIEAFANDYNAGSIATMALYLDGQLVKEEARVGHMVADLQAVSPGMHQIEVRATDQSGNVSTDTTTVYVGTRKVRVTIDESAKNGQVKLQPAGAIYSEGIEVAIEAIPDEGYRFHSWIKDLESDQQRLTVRTNDDIALKPVFVATGDPLDLYRKPIKINFGPLEGFYAPPGYLADGGGPYSKKFSGHTYGWLDGYNLSGSQNSSESNRVRATHNRFNTESGSYSWGIALPKGIYKLKLGLGAKKLQGAIKLNVGQLSADRTPLSINDPVETNHYQVYVLEAFEVKDGGSGLADARLTLSSANQTKIHFIEIEPVKFTGRRRLRVINGSGGGSYHDFRHPVLIKADPPAEGMVFDRWVGNGEPQYFEGIDQWKRSPEYIEDIYSTTTFVTDLDYITTVKATYRME
ncbi:MAG: hypothetical protein P8N76_11235 [Pirellulaceae bacterium]|nr:hypothetical protein [Pirellulaceae bacterium]